MTDEQIIQKFSPAFHDMLRDALVWRDDQKWVDDDNPDLRYDFCAELVRKAVHP